MRLFALFLTALVPAAVLAQTQLVPVREQDPKDGSYIGQTFPNGTVLYYEFDPSTLASGPVPRAAAHVRAARRPQRPASHRKRFTSCWGTALNHANTDAAVSQAKAVIAGRPGGVWIIQDPNPGISTTFYQIIVVGNVKLHFYANAPGVVASFDLVDFNWALLQMDTHCVPYTSSYYRWDGTQEIIGKSLANTPVCQG